MALKLLKQNSTVLSSFLITQDIVISIHEILSELLLADRLPAREQEK